MTVVVVDDNHRVADVYVEMLETLGHTAYPFFDGQTFLDALATLRPDLLIVDRRMRGLDGLEVARRARALRPDLPILMISAGPPGDAEEAAFIDRFLSKPCTITDFAQAVSELLAGGGAAGAH